MKINLTQAQSLFLQGLLTLVLGAVATALTTGYQAFVSGQISTPMLASFLFSSILIGVGKALSAYIPAHIPQELQAVKDTLQLQAAQQQEILSIVNGFTVPRPVVGKQPTAPTAVIQSVGSSATTGTVAVSVPPPPLLNLPTQPPPQMPDLGG